MEAIKLLGNVLEVFSRMDMSEDRATIQGDLLKEFVAVTLDICDCLEREEELS